ncbi:hypothetical protein MK805_10970 [Shimazuella sp. AN120528]|uniref:hypothetical protein n=1 Tax=Shimazuella soli TaxID=1892854 RepID=UPI001F0E306C|nr:hypothetical protein [Shimazuella soli]MCH5585473.1 hypothetical protein [Shimazuella soli]
MAQQKQRLHICGENSNGDKICLMEIFTPEHKYRITSSKPNQNGSYGKPAEAFRYFLGFTESDSRRAISNREGSECFFHRKRLHTYGRDREGNQYCVREVLIPKFGYRVSSLKTGSSFTSDQPYAKETNALRFFGSLAPHVDLRREIDDVNGEVCPVCA